MAQATLATTERWAVPAIGQGFCWSTMSGAIRTMAPATTHPIRPCKESLDTEDIFNLHKAIIFDTA